jgi:hypothetical protein
MASRVRRARPISPIGLTTASQPVASRLVKPLGEQLPDHIEGFDLDEAG